MPSETKIDTELFYKDLEYKILLEASKMLSVFISTDVEKPNYREWKSGFKKRSILLKEKCQTNSIDIPEEIALLDKYLLGKARDIYPLRKHLLASKVAWRFSPEEIETKKREIVNFLNEALNEVGGLQKNMKNFSPALGKSSRQRTAKRLLEDDDFLNDWSSKSDRYRKFYERENAEALLELVDEVLQK